MVIAEKWTNTSSPPSRSMNPKPFSFENHLTVPISDNERPPETCTAPAIEAIRLDEAARTVPSGTGEIKHSAPVARGPECALEEHCDRHRPGAAGHRRQESRYLADCRVDIAADPLVGARQSDIEARGTGLHHPGGDDARPTDCGHHDVCA